MLTNTSVVLTPKAEVWKVLRKVKKKWLHEIKCASCLYYENTRRQDVR